MKKSKVNKALTEHVEKVTELICGKWCLVSTLLQKTKLSEKQLQEVLLEIKKREELSEGEIVRPKDKKPLIAYMTQKSIFD